jgi:uncharacterized protein YbbK (DUF523 family)
VERIIVSACLLGAPVRYDGGAKTIVHETIDNWRAEGRLVSICPEMAGGLPAPRAPAEIVGLDARGRARVTDKNSVDYTEEFHAGAEAAVALAREHCCRFAFLKEFSPSCGSGVIYDGGFSGGRRPGDGVTAAALKKAGLAIFGETRIEELIEAIENAERRNNA